MQEIAKILTLILGSVLATIVLIGLPVICGAFIGEKILSDRPRWLVLVIGVIGFFALGAHIYFSVEVPPSGVMTGEMMLSLLVIHIVLLV